MDLRIVQYYMVDVFFSNIMTDIYGKNMNLGEKEGKLDIPTCVLKSSKTKLLQFER